MEYKYQRERRKRLNQIKHLYFSVLEFLACFKFYHGNYIIRIKNDLEIALRSKVGVKTLEPGMKPPGEAKQNTAGGLHQEIT